MIELDKNLPPQDRGYLVYVDEVMTPRKVFVPRNSMTLNSCVKGFAKLVSTKILEDFHGEIHLLRCEGVERFYERSVTLT